MIMSLPALAADWNTTIDRVLDSVVILKWDQTRAFGGDGQTSPQATGFVVDAERGLLLTNRHVVGTGPQVARGIFHDQEEVDLVPIYRDPVHDFAFYQYDPDDLRHIEPTSLQLSPERARVGTEVRLVGNDAGEQISILDTTLSRVDRDAPWWDFNTFFLQGASDSSGGSSGSPLFDGDGHVVALNSGGRNDSSTSMYLPLDRIVVALEALQRGETPPRGTLMAELSYRTYDELRRLGLTDTLEAEARAAWEGTGMLTVQRVGLGGPATDGLEEGDILLTVAGEAVYGFAAYEAALDARVGQATPLTVLRDGEEVALELTVADLQATVPRDYLSIDRGILHEVGYKRTLRAHRPPEGVVVADPGHMFLAAGLSANDVIESIDGRPIRHLDDAEEVLSSLPQGRVVTVRYAKLSDVRKSKVGRLRITPSLWPSERCARGDDSRWTCTPVSMSSEREEAAPIPVVPSRVEHKKARDIAARLVTVVSSTMLPIDSFNSSSLESVGLLVDEAEGLVLTDRFVVPHSAVVVTVRVGDAQSLPATVEWLDPLTNQALVRIDPTRLQLPPLAPLTWAEADPEVGDTVYTAAIDNDGLAYSQEMTFLRPDQLSLYLPKVPKYLPTNLEVLRFGKLDRSTLGGVVVDKKGRLVALYQRFNSEKKGRNRPVLFGISASVGRDAVDRVLRPDAGLALRLRPLGEAREAGLPDAQVARVRAHAPDTPQVLEVWRIDGRLPDDGVQVGDLVVAVDGQTVTTLGGFREATADRVRLQLVRDGELLEVDHELLPTHDAETTRAVLWAGALLQDELPQAARFGGTAPAGVYLSWYFGGSPASRYSLGYGHRLVAIEGQAVESLDDVLAAVADLDDREAVKVRLQALRGDERVRTLRVDTTWWPTMVFERGDDGWRRLPPG